MINRVYGPPSSSAATILVVSIVYIGRIKEHDMGCTRYRYAIIIIVMCLNYYDYYY